MVVVTAPAIFSCVVLVEKEEEEGQTIKNWSVTFCLNDEHISVCIHYSVLQELGWSGIKHNCNLIVFWVYIHV